jgi:hypothetical protein
MAAAAGVGRERRWWAAARRRGAARRAPLAGSAGGAPRGGGCGGLRRPEIDARRGPRQSAAARTGAASRASGAGVGKWGGGLGAASGVPRPTGSNQQLAGTARATRRNGARCPDHTPRPLPAAVLLASRASIARAGAATAAAAADALALAPRAAAAAAAQAGAAVHGPAQAARARPKPRCPGSDRGANKQDVNRPRSRPRKGARGLLEVGRARRGPLWGRRHERGGGARALAARVAGARGRKHELRAGGTFGGRLVRRLASCGAPQREAFRKAPVAGVAVLVLTCCWLLLHRGWGGQSGVGWSVLSAGAGQ